MIEIELRNILSKLLAGNESLEPYCKQLIEMVQKQHGALAGVVIGIEAREKVIKAAEELHELVKMHSMQKG